MEWILNSAHLFHLRLLFLSLYSSLLQVWTTFRNYFEMDRDALALEVFGNILISEKICSLLDTNSLKTCRQVSKDFCGMVTPTLNKRAPLSLAKMFASEGLDMMALSGSMAKFVSVDFFKPVIRGRQREYSDNNDKKNNRLLKKFVEEFADNLEGLSFFQGKGNFSSLVAILLCEVSKLKKLSITMTDNNRLYHLEANFDSMIASKKTFLDLKDLEVIEEPETDSCGVNQGNDCLKFRNWVKDIIGKSPNLVKLKVAVHYLKFDLSGLTNLKSLHYHYCPSRRYPFPCKDVTYLISKVANNYKLKELIISGRNDKEISHDNNDNSSVRYLHIPGMRNISRLTINLELTQNVKVLASDLDFSRFPNLKTLKIFNTALLEFGGRVVPRNPRVKALIIERIEPSVFEYVKMLQSSFLPWLEKVTITYQRRQFQGDLHLLEFLQCMESVNHVEYSQISPSEFEIKNILSPDKRLILCAESVEIVKTSDIPPSHLLQRALLREKKVMKDRAALNRNRK